MTVRRKLPAGNLFGGQTLDQCDQLFGALVHRDLFIRHLLTEQFQLIDKLLIVGQVWSFRDGDLKVDHIPELVVNWIEGSSTS